MPRKDGYWSGWDEYRHGSKRAVTLAPVMPKEQRKHAIDGVFDLLVDWRKTPFEIEGPVRAALRSAFCLKGETWSRADHEAASILTAAFQRTGACRPSWDEGQPEYADVDSICGWCLKSLPDEMVDGLRKVRFCSTECARAAIVTRDYLSTRRENVIAQSAITLITRTRNTVRECMHCGGPYHPERENKRQIFCSLRCRAEQQRTVMIRPCKQCGKHFKPKSNSPIFCSRVCYRVAHEAPQMVCVECGCSFKRKKKSQYLCSAVCARTALNRKPKTAIVIPFVPVHMLTATVIDGWFARAA